jgi:hypothetical protein
LVVGQDLAFLVGSVLADHDKGRQKGLFPCFRGS